MEVEGEHLTPKDPSAVHAQIDQEFAEEAPQAVLLPLPSHKQCLICVVLLALPDSRATAATALRALFSCLSDCRLLLSDSSNSMY